MDCRAARERARGWGPRLLLRSLPMIQSPYRKIQKVLFTLRKTVAARLFENLLQKLCIDLSKGFRSRAQSQLSNNAALTVRKIYFFSEIIKQQLP